MEEKLTPKESSPVTEDVANVETATADKKVESVKESTNPFETDKGKSVDALKTNKAFVRKMVTATENAFNAILDGENPSAKFLRQTSKGAVSNDVYKKILDTISPNEDYVPAGKGIEYILVNGIGVNRLDESVVVPEYTNPIDKYTYVDSFELPALTDKNVPHTELTIALWKYITFYLEGKVDQIAQLVMSQMRESLDIKFPFIKLMKLLKEIFSTIYAKPSSTIASPTNHLAGSKTEIVASMKEVKDFIFNAYSDNVEFNYGYFDQTGAHQEYTATYNNVRKEDLMMICSYETYNSLIASSTIFQNVDAVREYFNVGELVVLPNSWYDVDLGTESDPTKKGSVVKNDVFNDASGNRVKGAILFIDRRNLVRAYNWEYYDSQKFIMPATVEFVGNKNFGFKFLKWGQCAVYNNAVLESDFAFPVVVTDGNSVKIAESKELESTIAKTAVKSKK